MQSNRKVSVVRFASAVVTAAAIAMVAACGSDSTGPRNASATGTYDLTAVNGASLPYTVPNTGEDVEIVQDGTITLSADSTYAASATGTFNGSESTLVVDAGTYSVSGTQVTFTSTAIPGAHYTASIANGGTSQSLTATIAGAFVGSSDTSFTLTFAKIT
jgi:ABC-type oligopeptide transport system substrate-binding subunit